MPFFFPMEETVLLPLPLSWDFVPVSSLVIALAFGSASELRPDLWTVGEASSAGLRHGAQC
jgi:hypothetical protein